MSKHSDPRYGSVKILIEQGFVTSIQDIFKYIPKTTVYKDLGINFNRFDRAILNPSIFRIEELVTLAQLFNVDAKKFIDMAYDQILVVQGEERSLEKRKANDL